MDFLQGVKDMENDEGAVPEVPNVEDAPMPSVADLLKALDGMSGMSEEDKQALRDQLTQQGRFDSQGGMGFQQFLLLVTLLLVVASVFVFFGYKLYKSLTEKERKRDEKKKMKQMKKKK